MDSEVSAWSLLDDHRYRTHLVSAPRAASPSPAAEGEQPQVKATSAVEGNEEDTNQEDTTPQAKKANKRKAPAAKKQVVDSVIELESPSKRSRSSQSNALSASDKTHLISPQYLSADPARQCLTQLDFNAYLPQLDPSKEFLCMPSIYQSSVAPELHDLFKISAPGSASRKRDSSNKQDSPRKKQRTDENAPPSPEIGLRQSIPPSSEVGNDFEAGGGGADFGDLDAPMGDMSGGADFSNMENDFRFELESNKSRAPSEGAESRRSASVFSARSGASRRSNMFQEEDTMARGDADALLAPFDDLRLASTSRDVSRSPARSQEASQATGVNENVLKGKWSKSSRVAIKLLDQELGPVEDEQPDRSKSLSFEKAADKVCSRRDLTLLVLKHD